MTGSFNDFKSFKVDITSLLNAKQKETLSKINCMRIGVIDSVNGNVARCQITNKKTISTNSDGTQKVIEYPPIYARIYYMGSGSTGIDYALNIGSPCLLLFNDREFHSYFTTGQISPLADDRLHSLSDCICIPLIIPTEQNGDFNIYTSGNLNINSEITNETFTTKNITGDIMQTGNSTINGTLTATTLNATSGANGVFTSADGRIVTVTNGIVTSIS